MTQLSKLFQSLSNKFKLTRDIKSLRPILETYYGQDWQNYLSFKKSEYTRNLVIKDENIGLYLLYWDKYVKSNIHGHSENGCLFKVSEGNFLEKRYTTDNKLFFQDNLIIKNKIAYIEDNEAYHSLHNIHHYPITFLHIYSPPPFYS